MKLFLILNRAVQKNKTVWCIIKIQDLAELFKVQIIIQRQCLRWYGEDSVKNGVVKMLGCKGWKENPAVCGTPIGWCWTDPNDNDNEVSAELWTPFWSGDNNVQKTDWSEWSLKSEQNSIFSPIPCRAFWTTSAGNDNNQMVSNVYYWKNWRRKFVLWRKPGLENVPR